MESTALRFGLFADSHYAEMVYGDRHCRDSAAKVRTCIEVFKREELAFVVCMGDLIDKAEEWKTELGYLLAMRQVFEEYEGERHYVIGNHDVATLTKDEFLVHCGIDGARPYYSFERAGVHFAVLDGNCHADGSDFNAGDFAWDEAWVSEAQIEWLRRDLAAAGERPAIVLCHENLDDRMEDGVPISYAVRNAAQVRQILEEAGNVRAVIQAHYHPGLCATLGGIAYIGLRAMVVGAGLQNNAFAIAALRDDGKIELEGFGQQESFTTGRSG